MRRPVFKQPHKSIQRWLFGLSTIVLVLGGCGYKPDETKHIPNSESNLSAQSAQSARATQATDSNALPGTKATVPESLPVPPTAEAVPPTSLSLQTSTPTQRVESESNAVQNENPEVANGAASSVPEQKFTEEQLHKNATLLTLAMEPDIRAMELIKFLRQYLTDDQKRAAVEMILQYDHTFQDIKNRRAAILETAVDGADVAQQLQKIKEEMVVFSDEMRIKVLREILTDEQREQRQIDRGMPIQSK